MFFLHFTFSSSHIIKLHSNYKAMTFWLKGILDVMPLMIPSLFPSPDVQSLHCCRGKTSKSTIVLAVIVWCNTQDVLSAKIAGKCVFFASSTWHVSHCNCNHSKWHSVVCYCLVLYNDPLPLRNHHSGSKLWCSTGRIRADRIFYFPRVLCLCKMLISIKAPSMAAACWSSSPTLALICSSVQNFFLWSITCLDNYSQWFWML